MKGQRSNYAAEVWTLENVKSPFSDVALPFIYRPFLIKLTRVHSVRGHVLPFHDATQFLAEVDVGQFAAAVGKEGKQIVVEVLKVQLLIFVVGAREGDDSTGGTFFQAWQEQIGEEKMT